MTEEREHGQSLWQRYWRGPGSLLPYGFAQDLPEPLQKRKIVISPDQVSSKLPP
jgi:hypothetical protein